MLSYDNLWKTLIDKKMKKTDLKEAAKIGSNTLARLGKGETVDMQVLIRICKALRCNLTDIVEYTPDRHE